MKQKQRKNKKPLLENRSPLQQLNGLQIRKKSSNLSSSSSSSSVEAPKGYLGLLLSSNSSSAASSASSSRTHLERKHKALPKATSNVTEKSTAVALKVMPRSKENRVPRKPFSQISKNTKPIYKNAERFKLCSAVNKSKRGSAELVASLQNGSGEPFTELSGVSNKVNSNCIEENCTPGGKIASLCGLDSVSFDNHQNVSVSETDNNSAKSVKTPPIEASVSPEIQCGSQSKMLVCNSAATPICYGAGHLLSGVTDKRKCRRIGSLKGGCDKINLIDDEKNDWNVIRYSQDSPIPLLAEASVNWWLSPCDEGREDQGSDWENGLANASPMLGLSSSPSKICEDLCYLGCDNSDYNGIGSVDDVASKRNARINVLSCRNDLEIYDFLGSSDKKKHESLLVATPNSTSDCRGEGKDFGDNVVENNSSFSLSSLSSGNLIRTPNSDLSSDEHVGRLLVEVSRRNFGWCEVDSITEGLNTVCLSPRTEENGPIEGIESSSNSISLAQIPKNVDSVCSWVSDSTLENLALSQMRISWRDGIVSRIDENDEFDCCRCLSDEEIDADRCSRGDKGNELGIECEVSPIPLEYEPCISTRRKERVSPHIQDLCAESICTNGGDFVASADSDWTYFGEITCFRSNMN
ncbi:hypothetical protein CDL12_27891 [Handroanthus impetiginosus]|uniref:Uncharacterized protein n=1 Tax=Handroanthus impetiginosus TaxID=429701 RepID=A0A2G9G2S2_9LAMI|nr:hypothetical protein CDL12_27891 [Handroanthus impetiginosus]